MIPFKLAYSSCLPLNLVCVQRTALKRLHKAREHFKKKNKLGESLGAIM